MVKDTLVVRRIYPYAFLENVPNLLIEVKKSVTDIGYTILSTEAEVLDSGVEVTVYGIRGTIKEGL